MSKSEIAWPPRYEVGDLVDVTIRGARVTDLWDESELPEITVASQSAVFWSVRVDDPAVQVEVAQRRSPEQWPPRRGDVWRDHDGFSWFTREYVREDPMLVLDCCQADRWPDGSQPELPDDVLRDCGPLELIHRNPDAPPAPAALVEPVEPDDDPGAAAVPFDMTGRLVDVDALHELYGGLVMPVHDRPAPEPVP